MKILTKCIIRASSGALLIGAGLLQGLPAYAVPSFARQTGMACEACHTVFPELTHFGRVFKAGGYTLDNLKQVRGITATRDEMLSLAQTPPISIMLQASDTQLSKAVPDSTVTTSNSQNGTVAFPQQISIFYAGKIAPQVGAFIQLTYDNGAGTIGIDNTDLRYANMLLLPKSQSLIYGISLNNNPTIQDLWNTTPAFGFPYAGSNANVGSIAATYIDGTLGQDVAGLSAYVLWNESLYAELGAYRSAKQGASNPTTGGAGPLDGATSNVVQGVAPYFRVAYEYQWDRHSFEAGVYGATFKMLPGADLGVPLGGPTNQFKDVAEDIQYQFVADQHLFSLLGTRIHEAMTLDASFAGGAAANPSDDLTTLRLTGTYYYKRKIGGSLGYFSTTGSYDPVLYPAFDATGENPLAVIGSATGKPDTKGWIAEVNYVPWLNTKLSLQWTRYNTFNGASSNYDGAGRNASDNDTLYALIWFAY